MKCENDGLRKADGTRKTYKLKSEDDGQVDGPFSRLLFM